MKRKEKLKQILANSTGSSQWHEYWDSKHFPILTDGVKAVVKAGKCKWFLDIIGSHNGRRDDGWPRYYHVDEGRSVSFNPDDEDNKSRIKYYESQGWKQLDKSFQVWELEVRKDGSAKVTGSNDTGDPVIVHNIEYTDFPLKKLTFWVIYDGGFNRQVILLPSEY